MRTSKETFDLIQQEFQLHPFTLPALFRLGGAMYCDADQASTSGEVSNLSLIIKYHQKVELGTPLVSLTHDVAANRTDILICGYGVVATRTVDQSYGSLQHQLLEAILERPSWWGNPLLLPSITYHNYVARLEKRSRLTADEMINHEIRIGLAMNDDNPLKTRHPVTWPREINTRESTLQLYTLATHLTYLDGTCKWLHRLGAFILQQEQLLQEQEAFRAHWAGLTRMRRSTLFLSTVVDGLEQRFQIYQTRANLHVNALFSIVSQQNSALALLDSRLNVLIASSAKQDSISMTTFTFITALFLPGTFIATLFSMSMFTWQGNNSAGLSTPTGGASPESSVAGTFWIFWATVVPLTLVTLAGWYLWSKYARSQWLQALEKATNNEPSSLPLPSKSHLPSFLVDTSEKI